MTQQEYDDLLKDTESVDEYEKIYTPWHPRPAYPALKCRKNIVRFIGQLLRLRVGEMVDYKTQQHKVKVGRTIHTEEHGK